MARQKTNHNILDSIPGYDVYGFPTAQRKRESYPTTATAKTPMVSLADAGLSIAPTVAHRTIPFFKKQRDGAARLR